MTKLSIRMPLRFPFSLVSLSIKRFLMHIAVITSIITIIMIKDICVLNVVSSRMRQRAKFLLISRVQSTIDIGIEILQDPAPIYYNAIKFRIYFNLDLESKV